MMENTIEEHEEEEEAQGLDRKKVSTDSALLCKQVGTCDRLVRGNTALPCTFYTSKGS